MHVYSFFAIYSFCITLAPNIPQSTTSPEFFLRGPSVCNMNNNNKSGSGASAAMEGFYAFRVSR